MVRRHAKGRPMDSLPIVSAVAGAYLLAGFVKGVIGLGLPTVAIGLLGLLMTPAQAAAILVVPSLVTNIWQFAAGGDLLALVRRMWPLLAGICVGTWIGAVLLPTANGGQATMWLGVALAIYAGLGLFKIEFSVPPAPSCSWASSSASQPARLRWRPASSRCPAFLTFRGCVSIATGWCRRSACRSRYRLLRSLPRSAMPAKSIAN